MQMWLQIAPICKLIRRYDLSPQFEVKAIEFIKGISILETYFFIRFLFGRRAFDFLFLLFSSDLSLPIIVLWLFSDCLSLLIVRRGEPVSQLVALSSPTSARANSPTD